MFRVRIPTPAQWFSSLTSAFCHCVNGFNGDAADFYFHTLRTVFLSQRSAPIVSVNMLNKSCRFSVFVIQ